MIRGVFGSIGAFLAAIAVLIMLIVGGIYVFGTIKKETADFRGGVSQTESVKASGAYRIAAYDQFFNLCASIQAQEDTLEQMQTELDDPATTPERKMILRPSITGVKSSRAANIRQYNADAAKADTRANFLASSLPYNLDVRQPTVCAL